jgi:transcriptional regulator with GAF, ATPase, and Fis domain
VISPWHRQQTSVLSTLLVTLLLTVPAPFAATQVWLGQGLEVHGLAMENLRLEAELRAANERLRVENAQLKREAKGRYRFGEMVGTSPALHKMLDLVERVVTSDTTVLITGETGTGKELVARAIHRAGERATRPFIAVNCAALPESLLESELFGHKRGAFTGAVADHKGVFEQADGGTVLLDEIGDTTAALQVRLLRVLEEGEVRPVGGHRARRDFRTRPRRHACEGFRHCDSDGEQCEVWSIGVPAD